MRINQKWLRLSKIKFKEATSEFKKNKQQGHWYRE